MQPGPCELRSEASDLLKAMFVAADREAKLDLIVNALSKYRNSILSTSDLGQDETAWLVEWKSNSNAFGVPLYLRAIYADENWTRDANYALRFARKKDAAAVIHEMRWTDAEAVEHMWVYKAPEKLTQGEQTDDESNYDPARDPCNWPENIR